MIIQICIGSSCHLKGSERLVELFQDAIKDSGYYDEITLAGSFCTGRCNREGVDNGGRRYLHRRDSGEFHCIF